MKYKHIELMREIRLWAGQIFVPLFVGGIALWSNPEVRNNIHQMGVNAKESVENMINKFGQTNR